jgi:hypothetical protein
VTAGAVTHRFTAAELLSRPDLASIPIPPGVRRRRVADRSGSAVARLLATFALERYDRLEATAKDGFVAQIPLAASESGKSGGSVAWVAVEDSAHP